VCAKDLEVQPLACLSNTSSRLLGIPRKSNPTSVIPHSAVFRQAWNNITLEIMADLLQFGPFASAADPSFWHGLTKLKLETLKLSAEPVGWTAPQPNPSISTGSICHLICWVGQCIVYTLLCLTDSPTSHTYTHTHTLSLSLSLSLLSSPASRSRSP
jgi:hypothetical protein